MSKIEHVDFKRKKIETYADQWAKSMPHLEWLDRYFSEEPDYQVVLQTISIFLIHASLVNDIPKHELLKKMSEFWDSWEKISQEKE